MQHSFIDVVDLFCDISFLIYSIIITQIKKTLITDDIKNKTKHLLFVKPGFIITKI